MDYKVHRANERGFADHGWLKSRFSFSFAGYRNIERMGFGALRVINDDIIAPGEGFPMHPHQNMEIISFVTHGALEHKDSHDHHDVTREGEIQYMSAGTGINHSEYNPSDSESAELFQVWIHPKEKGGKPRYDKRDFRDFKKRNRWITLVSEDGRDGSMPIKQDARIDSAELDPGHFVVSSLDNATHGRLLFVVSGRVEIAGETLGARDEMQILGTEDVSIRALEPSRVMVFNVPV